METRRFGSSPRRVACLETFLRGMETTSPTLLFQALVALETFLRGMETGEFAITDSIPAGLETFLRGMETLAHLAVIRNFTYP